MSCESLVIDKKPIKSFGLITDIHYADKDDQWNYAKTFQRRYRNSLNLVKQACSTWFNSTFPLEFVVQLGDIIDRHCKFESRSTECLEKILDEFREINNICRIYHIWGNHEFYNFTREELLHGPLISFDTSQISPGHYGSWKVTERLRMIAIDTYEMSVLGYKETDRSFLEAMALLTSHNPNEDLNDPDGLRNEEQRFVKFNGGLKESQLQWLKKQLHESKCSNEKVLIVGHVPIHPKASDEFALLWNYKEVLETLWSFESLVIGYIAGHSHEGAYFLDEKNIHHLTLHAVVESDPDTNAFATGHVYDDFLLIEGYGRIKNYRFDY